MWRRIASTSALVSDALRGGATGSGFFNPVVFLCCCCCCCCCRASGGLGATDMRRLRLLLGNAMSGGGGGPPALSSRWMGVRCWLACVDTTVCCLATRFSLPKIIGMREPNANWCGGGLLRGAIDSRDLPKDSNPDQHVYCSTTSGAAQRICCRATTHFFRARSLSIFLRPFFWSRF